VIWIAIAIVSLFFMFIAFDVGRDYPKKRAIIAHIQDKEDELEDCKRTIRWLSLELSKTKEEYNNIVNKLKERASEKRKEI